MPNPKPHTTRRFRGRGQDIIAAIALNVLTAVWVSAFHFSHDLQAQLPRFFLRDFFDPCVPAGLFFSWVTITLLSYLRNPNAPHPITGNLDHLIELKPIRKHMLRFWFSYGFVFNLMMILTAFLLAWAIYPDHSIASGIWINRIQVFMAISFWITIFTYLPIMGALRAGGLKKYWVNHRHLFSLPASIAIHSFLIFTLFRKSLDWIFPNSAAPLEKSAILTLAIFSSILGFFLSLLLHRFYERRLFGVSVSKRDDLK